MTTKQTTAKKAAQKKQVKNRTTATSVEKPAKPKVIAKLSALNAAAKVLGETDKPLSTAQLIEAMGAKGYWTSPGGKTPAATLYAAILRELQTKGPESRFVKAGRGLFALRK